MKKLKENKGNISDFSTAFLRSSKFKERRKKNKESKEIFLQNQNPKCPLRM
jgi:hypothetical protein